jgi:hypothetical protein
VFRDQGAGRLVRHIREEGTQARTGLYGDLITGRPKLADQFGNHRNTGLAGSQLPGYRDAHITNLMHTDLSDSSRAITQLECDKSA